MIENWLRLLPEEAKEKLNTLMADDIEKRKDTVIYPEHEQILRAIDETDPENVKCVIIGQDPYHGAGQACGLAFAVNESVKEPPSLKNIKKEIELEYGRCNLPSDLSALTTQGVLLLNSVLTVEEGKAGSHKDLGWQAITGELLKIVIKQQRPVVFLCFGKYAIDLFISLQKECCEVTCIKGLFATHPSPLSAYRNAGDIPSFIGSNIFKDANKYLISHGADPIDWACVIK